MPWHLTTREVAEEVRARLDGNGPYALNVIDNPPNGFARAELATLAAVFPYTAAVVPDNGGNFVAIAGNAPLPLSALAERLRERNVRGRLLAGDELRAFVGDAPVLRDDYAPVDQLLTPYASR